MFNFLASEFLVAYITIVASDWPRTFFTPKVFLFSIQLSYNSGIDSPYCLTGTNFIVASSTGLVYSFL